MTPSINLLAESAEIAGDHLMTVEWELVVDDFVAEAPTNKTLSDYKEWVKQYLYYHGVVLANGGQQDAIDEQLAEDYVELLDAVATQQAG